MRTEIAIPEIKRVVEIYGFDLECDGVTNLLAYYLHKIGVEYEVFLGAVYLIDNTFSPHYWIESDEYIIDFRTRMWLGYDALEGVFLKSELKQSRMSYRKFNRLKPKIEFGKALMLSQQNKRYQKQEFDEFHSHLGKFNP